MTRALVGIVPVALLAVIACSQSSAPPDEVVLTPGTPVAQQGTPAAQAPVPAKPTSGCEELGALSAPTLTATLQADGTAVLDMTSFEIAGRPVTTKVRVVADGDPGVIVGPTATLGADVNTSFSTCTHCLLVAVGCTTDCSSAALFFPRSGTATLTSVATQPGQSFSGTFTGVELEEVTIDPTTLATRPVAGGACLHVTSLAFTAQAPGGSSPPSDAGSDAADAASSSHDGGGGNGGGSGGGGGGGGKSQTIQF